MNTKFLQTVAALYKKESASQQIQHYWGLQAGPKRKQNCHSCKLQQIVTTFQAFQNSK